MDRSAACQRRKATSQVLALCCESCDGLNATQQAPPPHTHTLQLLAQQVALSRQRSQAARQLLALSRQPVPGSEELLNLLQQAAGIDLGAVGALRGLSVVGCVQL